MLFVLFVTLLSTCLSYSPLCYCCCCSFACWLYYLRCHHLIVVRWWFVMLHYYCWSIVNGSLCCITITGPLLPLPIALCKRWSSFTIGKKGEILSLSIFNDLIIQFFQYLFFFFIFKYCFVLFLRGFFMLLQFIFLFIRIPTLTKTYSSYICIYLPLKRNFNNFKIFLYMISF